jgi:hypothetical protein
LLLSAWSTRALDNLKRIHFEENSAESSCLLVVGSVGARGQRVSTHSTAPQCINMDLFTVCVSN